MKKINFCIAALIAAALLTPCVSVSAAADTSSMGDAGTCCLAMDAKNDGIIYCDNMNTPCYPASITKIMTAMLIFNNLEPNDTITVTQAAADATPADSSGIDLTVGETFTVEEAEYILLLKSDNEMANAFAIKISGSISAFASLMNRTAQSLGANNTHFVNPSGYYADGHVTTCHDMALIMKKAVQNPDFVKVMSTPQYRLNTQTRNQTLVNDDQMILSSSPYYTKSVICGKTGYTDEAMHTLVSYASDSGRSVITVVMRATKAGQYDYTRSLLDIAFYK